MCTGIRPSETEQGAGARLAADVDNIVTVSEAVEAGGGALGVGYGECQTLMM